MRLWPYPGGKAISLGPPGPYLSKGLSRALRSGPIQSDAYWASGGFSERISAIQEEVPFGPWGPTLPWADVRPFQGNAPAPPTQDPSSVMILGPPALYIGSPFELYRRRAHSGSRSPGAPGR